MTEVKQKTMGKYCKAYPIARLRAYPNWSEKSENVRQDDETTDEGQAGRQLTDDGHLYLQENYVVTDGVFKDENIIFDDVTPEWIEYCQQTLEFEIPKYQTIEVAPLQDQSKDVAELTQRR